MSTELTFELVWLQTLTGGMEVWERGIPASKALARLAERQSEDLGVGCTVFLRPEQGAGFLVEVEREVAQVRNVPIEYRDMVEKLDEILTATALPQNDPVIVRRNLIQLAAMCMRATEDLDL